MLTELFSVARSVVAHNSPAVQAVLLENLRLNIASLEKSRPDVVDILLSQVSPMLAENLVIVDEDELGLTLYEKRQGQWTVLTSQSAAKVRARDYQQPGFNVIYFLGIGFGEEIHAWHTATANFNPLPNMRIALYVFEQNVSYFLLFLLTGNRIALIEDTRLLLFVGDAAFANYLEKACDDFINLPTQEVNLSYSNNRNELNDLLKKAVDFIIYQSNVLCSKYLTEMQAYYDSSFGIRLAKKIKDQSFTSLKIMAFTSRYTSFLQYGTRDWLQGFEALGCQVSLVIEPYDFYRSTPDFYLRRMYEFLPDIIIQIDSIRDLYIPENLPHYTWIQDDLGRLVNPNLPSLTNYDFISLLGKGWLGLFSQRAFYKSHPLSVLPLGFNPSFYYPLNQSLKDIDVLYVSHLIDPELTLQPYRELRIPHKKTQEELDWLAQGGDESLHFSTMIRICQWIDLASMDELLPIFDDIDARQSLLSTLIPDMDHQMKSLLSEPNGYRARIGNDILSQLKIRPMRQLANAEISFEVYGNHWHYFPEFKPYAKGAATNGEALNALQNRAKICLNNSAQISFHMRALEIMASGAFMLSRSIPKQHDIMSICELFNEGTEVVMFNEHNFIDVVNYYLEQPDLRERIAKAALVKLQTEHSYEHRAKQVLNEVKNRFFLLD